jgi:hypothetical protein
MCLGKKNEEASSKEQDVSSAAVAPEFDLKKYGSVEQFFYLTWGPTIVKYRKPIAATLIFIITVLAAIGSQFQTATDTPPPLPDDHMVSRLAKYGDDFKASDSSRSKMKIHAVFGIHPIVDRLGHSKFDAMTPTCGGGPCGVMNWDTTFDAADTFTQTHLLELCGEGAKIDGTKTCEFCLYKDLKTWRAANKNTTAWPIADATEFGNHVQEFLADPTGTPKYENRRNYIDSKLLSWDEDSKKIGFLSILFETDFKSAGQSYSYEEVHPFYLNWQGSVALRDSKDGLMTTHNKKAEDAGHITCDKGYVYSSSFSPNHFSLQTSAHNHFSLLSYISGSGLFIKMQQVKAFNDSAVSGILIALGFGALVLMIMTGNLMVTVISVISIIGIVISVVGMMTLYGWTLGVIESVCLTLVSGFSVDYVVHYGLSYIECQEDGAFNLGKGRQNRVRFAFFEMGVSVLGGSVTTIGASAFLFFCTIGLFQKFGIFMW